MSPRLCRDRLPAAVQLLQPAPHLRAEVPQGHLGGTVEVQDLAYLVGDRCRLVSEEDCVQEGLHERKPPLLGKGFSTSQPHSISCLALQAVRNQRRKALWHNSALNEGDPHLDLQPVDGEHLAGDLGVLFGVVTPERWRLGELLLMLPLWQLSLWQVGTLWTLGIHRLLLHLLLHLLL